MALTWDTVEKAIVDRIVGREVLPVEPPDNDTVSGRDLQGWYPIIHSNTSIHIIFSFITMAGFSERNPKLPQSSLPASETHPTEVI